MGRRVNYKGMVEFLDNQIYLTGELEKKKAKNKDYSAALEYRIEKDTYEFLKEAVTTDDELVIADFIERDEER